MTNVYLYGELRNKFGEEFKFNINSPKEAFLAINSNKRGFLNEVKKLAMQGIHYRIVVDDNVVQHPKEIEVQKAPKEIHIVPIVWGAGKNGALIAIGLVLTIATAGAAGVFAGAAGGGMAAIGTTAAAAAGGATTFTALGTALMSIGIGIALQGVMGLLFPPPKPDFNQEVQAGGKSYLFGNKPSNTSQGQAIPVGYGRLKIGSSQISAGIDHYRLNTDIKQLMTPVDKAVNDYIQLIAEDESTVTDSFSTQQSSNLEDSITFCSVNILNSYIDITTNSADKVISNPVEVVVKRNAEIISNPNLTTFDDDVTYEWEELSNDSSKKNVKPENLNNVKSGLFTRSYHAKEYKHKSDFRDLKSNDPKYFVNYSPGNLVKFGLAQFQQLNFATWDTGYNYFSGELVNFPTGNDQNTYFQARVETGFSGLSPTGHSLTIQSDWWREIKPPTNSFLYKCVAPISGHLPTTGQYDGSPPLAQTAYWSRVESPTTMGQMDTLFNDYPIYSNQKEYLGEINIINEQVVQNSDLTINNDNYGMEFVGYFYVPTIGGNGKSFIKDIYEVGTGTGLYEIIKIGDTGQWSGIGFTGIGGVALPPKIGATFYKKNVQGNGNGKVMPVQQFQFKLDSDDASDLYIDSALASSYYGGHGMFSGFADPFNPTHAEINALPSTTTTLNLTAGYHRLLARFQDAEGGDGISLYYRYDTNKDGIFSNWQLVPKEKLFYNYSDPLVSRNEKFSNIAKATLNASEMIVGEKYKIVTTDTTNWTSIGSSSTDTQTVFFKNSTAATNNGVVTNNFISYSEQKSADSNRLIRFIAERPKINGVKSSGYSSYKARYRCKVTINNKQTIYSSPVKLNIEFLSTPTNLAGIGDPKLSENVQAS